MHIYAYITSRQYSLPGMCGRSYDFSAGHSYAYLKVCDITNSLKGDHEFPRFKSLNLALEYYLLTSRNITLNWQLHLSRKQQTQPRWHFRYNKGVQGEDTVYCEHLQINLIKFLACKFSEIFQKISSGLTKEENDHSRIIKYLKRCIPPVFKVDQHSFVEEMTSALTTQKSKRNQSISTHDLPNPTLSLRNFAHEFAKHKEVPGDQLKPSKERIKNVNTSNQQRRC